MICHRRRGICDQLRRIVRTSGLIAAILLAPRRRKTRGVGLPATLRAITPPQPRCFRLLLQNRELLSKREILRREFCSVTKDAAEEQHQDANRAHFTASDKVNHGPETIAAAPKGSIRNSFAPKAYGIFGMDRGHNALRAIAQIPQLNIFAACRSQTAEELQF